MIGWLFYGVSTLFGSFNTKLKFQTIQFSKSTQFSSIWPIDRALSGPTTLGQGGPGSDGNEEVLRIPQSFSITEASPSEHSLRESYPSEEI